MNTATQPSIDLPPPSASDDRQLVMDRLWHRLAQTFGLDAWTAQHGAVGGENYQSWTDGLMDYTVDQLARGVSRIGDWKESQPPDLKQFSRLCLMADTRKPEAAQPPHLPPPVGRTSSRIALAEIARQERIAASPKGRSPSPADVESLADSYHRCGLGGRWPGGRVEGI